jgi:hypothetical protein
MIPLLLMLLLVARLLGGGRRRDARSRRGGFGFFGPFPTYSTRTRRGTRVWVSGCCLPIPLAVVSAAGLGLRMLLRRSG